MLGEFLGSEGAVMIFGEVSSLKEGLEGKGLMVCWDSVEIGGP